MEQLQAALSARQSTRSFAQFAIALAVAVIVAGAAGKLSWDAKGFPYLGIAAGLVAAGITAWAVRCYRRGMSELKLEIERFERWQALRRSLGIDDPAALLPRR